MTQYPSELDLTQTTPNNSSSPRSRKLPFFLRVYLDSEGASSGELYWDDGDSIDSYESGAFNHITFRCSGASKLRSVVEHRGYDAENMTLDMVSVFGVQTRVSSVAVNGRDVKFFYDEKIQARNTFRDENYIDWITPQIPPSFVVFLYLGSTMLA